MTNQTPALIAEFSGAPIDWELNPGNYRFLRLAKGESEVSFADERKVVVGVARSAQTTAELIIFYKQGDFEAEAYREFPSNPHAKPVEAVAGSFFLENGYPRRHIP